MCGTASVPGPDLSSTDAIPVHYVFPRHHINVAAAVQALKDASTNELKEKRGVVVVWDVAYDWRAGKHAATLTLALTLQTRSPAVLLGRWTSRFRLQLSSAPLSPRRPPKLIPPPRRRAWTRLGRTQPAGRIRNVAPGRQAADPTRQAAPKARAGQRSSALSSPLPAWRSPTACSGTLGTRADLCSTSR